MENAMTNVMFEIPSNENVEKCIVTKDSIEGKGEPEIVYGNVKGSKKSLSRKLSDKKTSETA